jgi:tRNA (guanine37-N1)-methyltransferase
LKKHISKVEEEVIPNYLTLGKVTGVFGLKGEVRVFLHNPESNLFHKKRLVSFYFSDDHIEERKMSCRSGAGKRILGRVEGITNKEQAESLVGSIICIHSKYLPHTEDDEFYHYQLLGLSVVTESGAILGLVTEIVPAGISKEQQKNTRSESEEQVPVDILIVENEEMKYYIPFTKEDVLEISLKTGIVVPDMNDGSSGIKFDILTLHPDMCKEPLQTGIIGRACEKGIVDVQCHNFRDFGLGSYKQVDDTPYGGGSGMVIRVDVLAPAIESLRQEDSIVLLMDPGGKVFEHSDAVRLSQARHLIFVCGHYEGIDHRVHERYVDEIFSIGDYVLTGGELPAMVMINAISRHIPEVLGNKNSVIEESFTSGFLEHPVYTKPSMYEGDEVPEILRSGNHEKIRLWREKEAIARTQRFRPDLINKFDDEHK